MGHDVISRWNLHQLSVPLRRPLVSGIHRFQSLETVVLQAEVGDVTGTGYAFTFSRRETEAVAAIAAELAELSVGKPLEPIRGHDREFRRVLNYAGLSGISTMARAAVNTALWDASSRTLGLPLWRLFGMARDAVPAYISGGWLSYTVDELIEDMLKARDGGFHGYKMKVGSQDWRRDVPRVEAVVEAAAGAIDVMVDVNQAWDVDTAIQAGRTLQALGVNWLEEPIDAHDIDGHARVAAALDMRVASGESLWGLAELRDLVERPAADVLMPDLMRCGGPDEFLAFAQFADALGRPVSSHLFTEVSAHLMACVPRPSLVEYVPDWFDDVFAPQLVFKDGNIVLGDEPGASTLTSEAATRFACVPVQTIER